jgi:hypothetical protein
MYSRTQTTVHATEAEALDRLLDIANAQKCRIDGDKAAGAFIPQITNHYGDTFDAPSAHLVNYSYRITAA